VLGTEVDRGAVAGFARLGSGTELSEVGIMVNRKIARAMKKTHQR
jgi:hypothetical protein